MTARGQGHEHRESADTVDAVQVARAWLADDPDPDTRADLQALLDAEDLAGIADRFGGRLEFGTAGLRGELGAGPNRMNRVVVTRAAAGLCSYLTARGGRSVVVGFDARHKSDVFARDTAEVVTGAGMRALVLPRPLPTPVLAFAIRHLGADAGVMVTASHNPPQDNGYKVYLGDGSQIVPPADAEISAAIEAVGPLPSVPRGDEWDTLGDEVLEAYLDRVASLVDPATPRDLAIVYTPLHGVDRAGLLRVGEGDRAEVRGGVALASDDRGRREAGPVERGEHHVAPDPARPRHRLHPFARGRRVDEGRDPVQVGLEDLVP